MVRTWIFFFTMMLAAFCKAEGQQYYLYHADVNKACKDIDVYYLYSSINNKVVVRTHSNVLKPHDVLLVSDSALVKRINDSLYSILPVCQNTYIKLFIVNKQTKEKVDSVRSFCEGNPFSFSINDKKVDTYFSDRIIKEMKFLALEPLLQGCLQYTSSFSIISYDLVLKRGDSDLLMTSFKGNKAIGNSFKKKLNKVSKSGDGLFAKNIILKCTDGREIKVDEYSLLKVQ